MKAEWLAEKRLAIDLNGDSLKSAPWTIVRSFGSELELELLLPTGFPFWFQDLP